MLAQFAVLEISPDSRWPKIEAQYQRLSEFWNPERFSYNRKEQRKAEFRFRQINRAFAYLREHRELFEEKKSLSAEKTSCFSCLGTIPLSPEHSALQSTRRDVSHNMRVGRMLLALSSLWPYNRPDPWGIKAPSKDILGKASTGLLAIYRFITLPIELLCCFCGTVLYRYRLQLLFVIIALLFMKESAIHIGLDGGKKSSKIQTEQARKNTYVMKSSINRFFKSLW